MTWHKQIYTRWRSGELLLFFCAGSLPLVFSRITDAYCKWFIKNSRSAAQSGFKEIKFRSTSQQMTLVYITVLVFHIYCKLLVSWAYLESLWYSINQSSTCLFNRLHSSYWQPHSHSLQGTSHLAFPNGQTASRYVLSIKMKDMSLKS